MEWLKEHKLYVVAGIAAALLFYLYSSFNSQGSLTESNDNILTEETAEQKIIDEPAPEEKTAVMMADIKGAIVRPGVYEVAEGDRVIDLIKQAGGITQEADAATINFAMRVTDEMAIYIPKKGEQIKQASQQSSEKKLVNLNSATASDLETLPGIGPSKAEAIIDFRETNGPYRTIDDLKKISGIGEKTFEKLKNLISVK